MYREQKLRIFLFVLSTAIFFAGLPFILSYALGYKFNPRTLRFTKTGLVALKTQPPGADIYLEKRLLKDKTPATITELLPGRYQLRVVLEDYYPWTAEVEVEAGKVARFEKIILFSIRPEIEKVNSENSLSFWLDDKRNMVYYIDQEDYSIYRSSLDAQAWAPEKVSGLSEPLMPPVQWKASSDQEKLLCFGPRQWLVLPLYSQSSSAAVEHSLFPSNITQDRIVDIFWHSDNYHIIVVTDKNIVAFEARPGSRQVVLASLNKKNTTSFYDVKNDMLYFLDSQQAADGKFYDNIYRLDLNIRFSAFRELMRMRANGQGQKNKKNF